LIIPLLQQLNRLWVRLSLAFALVVMFGVMITSLIGILITTSNLTILDYSDVLVAPNGPVEILANYYEEHEWHNAQAFMAGLQSSYLQTDAYSLTFSLIDNNGSVIYDSHPAPDDPRWPYIQFDEVVPVRIDGIVQGYLRGIGRYSEAFETQDFSPQTMFLNWLKERIWLMSFIGGTIGVIAGIFVSRSLAAPLYKLSEAARGIAARDLTQRVPVAGTTEMIQLAQAFNEMGAALEQAETLRRNLVADVAHELRTPLTVLQGNLRAILDDVYKLDKAEVASLYNQTRVLNRLVNDLHELAQAEARQLPMRLQTVNLQEVVARVVDYFSPVAEAENIQLVVSVEENLPTVWGDFSRLTQVLNNLITNALHHTPEHGSIFIELKQVDDQLALCVADTGKGIPPEHQPHIFERFYRADRARSRNTGGAGLGLAIVKAIVEAHDGTVSLQSDGIPGKGAAFTVLLPIYGS